MSCVGTAVISVVVLQNCMDLLKGELGYSNKTCVSSAVDGNVIGLETERISNMTQEVDQEPRTVPVIKAEPMVSGVSVVCVTHIAYRLYPELPTLISVCPYETKSSI